MPNAHAPLWDLDPAVVHLNHGSFGAVPREVRLAQREWADRFEADGTRFVSVELEPALDAARAALADFVGAEAQDLVFVPNATTAMNAVLRSMDLRPGDELLTTDHAYNAAKTAMEYVAARSGANVTFAPIPFPITDPDDAVAGLLERVTPRTRLVVVDHITSPTALLLPVATIVRELAARGVETLVDGAHAPGQVELDLSAVGAAYYTGNLHKWLCAPKGSAFLHVRRDLQPAVRPLAISHGANAPRTDRSRYLLEFDWTGTGDPSAYLAVPDAIAFGRRLADGGWPEAMARQHRLCLDARDRLLAAVDVSAPAPDEMIGCMASVPMAPEASPGQLQGVALYGDPLHDALLAEGLQVMVTPWPQRPEGGTWRRLVRLSVGPYTDVADIIRLVRALERIAQRRALTNG